MSVFGVTSFFTLVFVSRSTEHDAIALARVRTVRRARDRDRSIERSIERDKKFNFLCPYSRGNGCRFKWDTAGRFDRLLSGFKDGKYELRLKNFCTEADALADASIHEYVSEQKLLLTVDTVAPVITRTFSNQQYFGVEFVENIDCSDVQVEVTKRYDACGQTATAMNQVVDVTIPPYEIRCFNTSQGTFSIKFADADVGQYEITVRGIKDGAGFQPYPSTDGSTSAGDTLRASAPRRDCLELRLARATHLRPSTHRPSTISRNQPRFPPA